MAGLDPPPRKIVVAVDGSDNSMRAARAALSLARAARAPLTAVMAIRAAKEDPVKAFRDSKELAKYLRDHADEAVSRMSAVDTLCRVEDLGRRGKVKVRTRVLEGHPAVEIAKFAEKRGFDLLVVGSRGLSGLKRTFLGSVSGALVQGAKVPVLVVK